MFIKLRGRTKNVVLSDDTWLQRVSPEPCQGTHLQRVWTPSWWHQAQTKHCHHDREPYAFQPECIPLSSFSPEIKTWCYGSEEIRFQKHQRMYLMVTKLSWPRSSNTHHFHHPIPKYLAVFRHPKARIRCTTLGLWGGQLQPFQPYEPHAGARTAPCSETSPEPGFFWTEKWWLIVPVFFCFLGCSMISMVDCGLQVEQTMQPILQHGLEHEHDTRNVFRLNLIQTMFSSVCKIVMFEPRLFRLGNRQNLVPKGTARAQWWGVQKPLGGVKQIFGEGWQGCSVYQIRESTSQWHGICSGSFLFKKIISNTMAATNSIANVAKICRPQPESWNRWWCKCISIIFQASSQTPTWPSSSFKAREVLNNHSSVLWHH